MPRVGASAPPARPPAGGGEGVPGHRPAPGPRERAPRGDPAAGPGRGGARGSREPLGVSSSSALGETHPPRQLGKPPLGDSPGVLAQTTGALLVSALSRNAPGLGVALPRPDFCKMVSGGGERPWDPPAKDSFFRASGEEAPTFHTVSLIPAGEAGMGRGVE